MRQGPIVAFLTFLAGVVIGVAGWSLLPFFYQEHQAKTTFVEQTDRTATPLPSSGIWALGRLEPAGGVIDLLGIPGDRLLRLDVQVGSVVNQGTRLGQWESELLRQMELQLAEAQWAEANQQWRDELARAREQVAMAQLAEDQTRKKNMLELAVEQRKLDSLRLAVKAAEQRLQRLSVLMSEAPNLVAQAEIEEAQWQCDRAAAELAAGEADWDAARQAGELSLRRATAERQAAERAVERLENAQRLEALRHQVALARQRYLDSQFLSPAKGQVIRLYTQPGERVGQQPVLQIADVSRMVCIAEVPFDQIAQIQVGQIARIYSRAFGDSSTAGYLEGRVEDIGKTAAMPGLRALDPFAPADRHSLEVRIGLDEKASSVAARFLYLQTEVQFLVDRPAEQP